MTTKEISIDLHGVQSKLDIILRFAKALCLTHGGGGWTEESRPNWDAFSDDLASLYFMPGYLEGPKPDKLILKINGAEEVRKHVSEKEYKSMIDVLEHRSDPTQRHDRIDFSFELV